jgi:Contractile injection system tape measure protein
MADLHVIEQLRAEADIRGVSPEEAESRWSNWLRNSGLALLDQVLDECFRESCADEDVWPLSSLTLDLGTVEGPDWEAFWSRELPRVARKALEDQRGPAGAGSRPSGVRSRTQSRLAWLLHFLRHGRWPWQARHEDPRLLAQELLQRDPTSLLAALRQEEDRAQLVRRLVLQFDRGWLAALVQALMPGRPAHAQRLLSMVSAHGLHGQAPTGLMPLWEVVLEEALSAEGAPHGTPITRARQQLKVALTVGAHVQPGADPLLAMGDVWLLLLRDDPVWLRETLQAAARLDGQRQRLYRVLPAQWLPSLLTLWMDSRLHQEVQRWIETVLTAAPATTAETQERRTWLWQATLDQALRGDTPQFEPIRYTAQVREHLSLMMPDGPQAPRHWFDKVVSKASAVLSAAARKLGLRWRSRDQAPASPAPTMPVLATEAAPDLQAVGNAGLVLLHPYLPHLFQRVGLATIKGFKDPDAARRGALLLQALVLETPEDGGGQPLRQQAMEHELGLNKLLCGLPLGEPLPREWTLTTEEREVIEGLLTAVVQHWRVLGGTSVNGFRQTFLRRAGGLGPDHEGWRLKVDPGPFDMLIDHLPWGYSVVKFGWMERVLHVDWR